MQLEKSTAVYDALLREWEQEVTRKLRVNDKIHFIRI